MKNKNQKSSRMTPSPLEPSWRMVI